MSLWSDTGAYTPFGLVPKSGPVGFPPIPEDAPDCWLSRSNGDYCVGLSYHFYGFYPPIGAGKLAGGISYGPSPFFLKVARDPYNPWDVQAVLNEHRPWDELHDWLPGVLVVDETQTFTLPDYSIAGFAGTEWADNDRRVFHSFADETLREKLLTRLLEAANQVTGPGFSGWPFGQRQLANAAMCWVPVAGGLPEAVILVNAGHQTDKLASQPEELQPAHHALGTWADSLRRPWDVSRAVSFLYQAKLALEDGLPELALAAAVAALENCSAEALLYLLGGDEQRLDRELSTARFLDRFDQVLPLYGLTMPRPLFERLRTAYFARNGVVHGLRSLSADRAAEHVQSIEDVIVWIRQQFDIPGGRSPDLGSDEGLSR